MALANVGALLARWGNQVLLVDWDIEAAGIERYFETSTASLREARAATPGIVDLIDRQSTGKRLDWHDCLLKAYPFGADYPLYILSAGQDNSDYVPRFQSLDWVQMFEMHQLGAYLEELRNQWISEFDFILVDSRTGITDIGGICTVYLPDIVVLFFTTNRQSLDGVIDVMTRAASARNRLPFDRSKLVAIPVPARDESRTEYEEALKWRKIFSDELASYYQDWLPYNKGPEDILQLLRIPYIPYWSFGERLPVAEEGTSDPTSLGYAYASLAKLIVNRLSWQETSDKTIKISGDVVAEIVKDQSSNVVIGKNIVQLGSLQLPATLFYIILGLLTAIVGLVTYLTVNTASILGLLTAPTPTVTPTLTPTFTPTPTSTETANPTPTSTPIVAAIVIAPEGANLRDGPSFQNSALANLPEGTKVMVINRSIREGVEWWQVLSPNGEEGWVTSALLTASVLSSTPTPTSTVTNTATPIPSATPVAAAFVIASEGANLRDGSSFQNSVLTNLPEGTKVTVINRAITEGVEWWQVLSPNGEKGWVVSALLTAAEP
jgi:uncharacterized protein YgiM (DUF1202 family)